MLCASKKLNLMSIKNEKYVPTNGSLPPSRGLFFQRHISSKCLDLDDDAHSYMTGGAKLNFIYITRHTDALDKILTEGKQFFDQDNLSFDVIIPQELCTPQIADVLNAMGYTQKSKSVSMVMGLDRFATDKTGSFDSETTIKSNDNQLNDWMIPLIGFKKFSNKSISTVMTFFDSLLLSN
jgi:hypothetical protein